MYRNDSSGVIFIRGGRSVTTCTGDVFFLGRTLLQAIAYLLTIHGTDGRR